MSGIPSPARTAETAAASDCCQLSTSSPAPLTSPASKRACVVGAGKFAHAVRNAAGPSTAPGRPKLARTPASVG